MDEDMKDFLEKMNKGRYDLELFDLYMRPEESFTYTISGGNELFEAFGIYSGYDVSEVIEEKIKDNPLYHEVDWDSESGCFFAYSNNVKAIVMVVETIQSLVEDPIDEKKWNEFKNHPSNRMRLLV